MELKKDIFVDTDCYLVAIKDEHPARSNLERINRKYSNHLKIAKISQYNFLPQNVVDPPLENTKIIHKIEGGT